MEDDERDQLGQLPDFTGRSPPGAGVDATRSDSSSSPPRLTSSVSSLGSVNTRPALFEATGYFQGLFSGERLIARSNQLVEPFEVRYDRNWPDKKHLCNIGSHPIVRVYDQSLRSSVREAVATLEWWRIDIIRIGFSNREIENPVFILITVNAESVSYEAGQKAVDACRGLLVQYVSSNLTCFSHSSHFNAILTILIKARPQRRSCIDEDREAKLWLL